ncbi:MAG: hypothetical protein ACREPS_00720 [Rhodanobacteraceae bacterium]
MFGDASADNRRHAEPSGTLGCFDSRDSYSDDPDHAGFPTAGGVRLVTANRHRFGPPSAPVSMRCPAVSNSDWRRPGNGHFVVMVKHVSSVYLPVDGKNFGETMRLASVRF